MGEAIEAGDLGKYFHRMQRRLNKMKKAHEEELKEMLQQVTTFNNEDYSQQASHTTIMEKALK
jgi:hypothetical protein